MTKLLVLLALAGCGDLKGFSGPVPPLASYTVNATGTLDTPPHHLSVALVWGMQWLPEPFCIPGFPVQEATPRAPTASDPVLVQQQGCRDPFGFVPARVEANSDIALGGSATIDLFQLPAADVLVGDLTARTAYGSMVLYDDRNDNSNLELARPNRLGVPMEGPGSESGPTMLPDEVLGASFVSMTLPDQRVGYREGAFNEAAAFYPRAGCGDPPPAFSVLGASGFTFQAAVAATLAGTLPQESDLSQCVQTTPDQLPITVTTNSGTHYNEVACTERNADSSVRYREPPGDSPDFTGRLFTCIHLPTFDPNAPPQPIELIVTGVVPPAPNPDSCAGLTHYVLKGCREDPNCGVPDWDVAPPSWWPCPAS